MFFLTRLIGSALVAAAVVWLVTRPLTHLTAQVGALRLPAALGQLPR